MKFVVSAVLTLSVFTILAGCGGATAERAKDDINGVGSDLRSGVSDSAEAIKTDGGPVMTSDAGDKK